uniref:integrator complex subunit 9-like n=1 Tax=Styela clava TaxID=7725 RepID=UPI00193ABAFE|nr:integrator complex subunit 9-like [Styela clava]
MRVYNLSPSDTCPCIVLKFKSCTIMLDCSLDLLSSLKFLPCGSTERTSGKHLSKWVLRDSDGQVITDNELKECSGSVFVDSSPEFCIPEIDLLDLSTVDVILVSNYFNMLAVPYLTEYCGFQGAVYATDPSHQIGRLFMKEMVQYCHRLSPTSQATKWKNEDLENNLPASLKDVWNNDVLSWRQCYNENDLHNALSRVHVVGYAEKISIFGSLTISAYSSGFAIGSCNWCINSDYEKIVYMSDSSSLTTHPQPMDITPLRNSDALIFTGLSRMPTNNPDNMISEFCSCLAVTLKAGGNVLVPCFPSGLVYDLLECLLAYLDQAGLTNIPIYFISPVAKDSLAFSQVYSEWLHPNKQNKVYLPEPPFPHDELIAMGKLKVFSSIHEGLSASFKKPCIVFAGHPSLRFGDAVHFIEMWKNSATNSVIFVEPNFPYLEVLAPFQPLQMKAYHFEIDTRTNPSAANLILNDLKAKHVIVPTSYTKPPVLHPHRTDLCLQLNQPLLCMDRKSVLPIDVKRQFEKVQLSADLSATLLPAEVRPGVMLAALSGELVVKDNKHKLKLVTKPTPGSKKRKFQEVSALHRPLMWGKLHVDNLLDNLIKEGYTNAKVEDTSSGHMILLRDTIIQIDEDSTHIVCEGNESLRIKLRDILLRSLSGL